MQTLFKLLDVKHQTEFVQNLHICWPYRNSCLFIYTTASSPAVHMIDLWLNWKIKPVPSVRWSTRRFVSGQLLVVLPVYRENGSDFLESTHYSEIWVRFILLHSDYLFTGLLRNGLGTMMLWEMVSSGLNTSARQWSVFNVNLKLLMGLQSKINVPLKASEVFLLNGLWCTVSLCPVLLNQSFEEPAHRSEGEACVQL